MRTKRLSTALTPTKDLENKIELRFYSNGNFVGKMEPGHRDEGGKFALDGDRLVLNCGSGRVDIGEDGTFTYTSTYDPALVYQFKMSPADMEKLKSVL